MRVKINLKVYGVGYADGVDYWTADDEHTTLFFQFYDKGEWYTFESEAYHLSAWCRKYGFTYYCHQETIWVNMEAAWTPETK
jgi:hypothetical protein